MTEEASHPNEKSKLLDIKSKREKYFQLHSDRRVPRYAPPKQLKRWGDSDVE